MRTRSIKLIAAAVALLMAQPAAPCQQPPDNIPCRLDPTSPVVNKTDPFEVILSFANYPTGPPYPPPFLDDLIFEVDSFASDAFLAPPDSCQLDPTRVGADVDPQQFSVRLDEAWSPYADEPSSHTEVLTITPLVAADAYGLWTGICAVPSSGPGPGCDRTCNVQLCIPAVDDPQALPTPYALFLDPARSGDAGSPLPFQLRVLRNGYAAGVPLTVRVTPQNASDPLDIFPIAPAEITGPGVEVTGDDVVVEFACTTHYPCFVGVENYYHVTISDGATVLWDSTWVSSDGIGRAVVDRSPMARVELIEVLDDGGNGAIAVGEHATIHLRLYGRNPYFSSSLSTAALEAVLPAGISVQSWELHHHDNPMDTYDPTPMELAASGTVTTPPGVFRVDTSEIVARFTTAPVTPPAVFHDLFEVELFVETDAGGLSAPVDLAFDVRVTGTADGVAKDETSPPVIVAVNAALPPNPVPALLAVRDGGDVRLVWDDSPTDPTHGAAFSYRIYRAEDAPVTWSELVEVADTPATREETIDTGAASAAADLYYRAAAFNPDGDSGDVP